MKGLAILALIVAMCALVAAAAVPPTPFMIYGYVLYENGSACDNPVVNVTNLNTSIEWQANSHTSSNDYYLTLAAGADLNERETLRFDVSSPDGNPLYTTEHAVSSEEINNGGIFNFDFPPGVTAPALVVYTISNRTITAPQTTEIDVKFSEEVEWTIAVEDSGVVYDWSGTSTNPNHKIWNGTFETNGTIVPDGIYTVKITWINTTTGLGGQNNTETITVSSVVLPVHNLDTGEDFATIQAAIDDGDTEEGHTITVDPGTYTENVVVNRSISLIGADRNTTIIDGSGYGTVVNVTANNVNISGFTMKNSGYLAGIKLSSDHNTLTDINVMNNDRGIKLWNSNNNTLVKNNISTNNYGILMDYSNNNFFSNNNINKNHHGGILMMNSNNNTITYINANSNYGSGIAIENSNNNTIMNNNANSNRHHSGISIGNSNNNLLINNTATSNYGGICIGNSNNNILTKNNASFNKGPGISLHDSNNNALTENNASFNKGPSISIWHSNNNTLTENNASFGGVGIELWISNNNTLTSNIMNSNEINFDVYGNALSDYIHKIDTSNMVNGKPIYYLVNEQKRIIDSTSNPGYIGIVSSSGIIVRNLTLMNNGQGILFVCVNKSKIENTTISNNGDGIYLLYSNNNSLINNNADSNKIISINLEYSNNNILTNNSANLNLNNNGIVLGSSNNNTLSNNSANSNDDDGIRLDGSNNNVLTNNTAKSNWVGIGLYGSCYNILTNNNADSNHVYGIILGSESNNNTLSNNSANTNHWRDGIELMGSSNNTLSNNSANSNSDNGINLDGSNNNILTNNSANRNNKDGVRLSGSNNNTLANNNVNLNNNYGIYLRYSSNNFIFHNNLVNNSNNAYDTNPANNDWHHPALLEGNYWSDYSGLDDGTGTGKHAIAGDGIGDTNIPHPAEDYDFYPFMTESLWTNTKRSLETATGTGSATLSTSGGYFSYVSAVNESSLPSEGKPNRQFPHGFFSFNITGLTTGQTVNVTITLPSEMPTTTQYWKYQTPEGVSNTCVQQ
ncbi:MAG: Cell surface glycoprotein [Candidatus Methanophagaceae archaeon]|nr:MAG: Cell surface glycoprotein [Methanophagales archaeon]